MSKQLTPQDVLCKVAKYALVIGPVGVLFIGVMLVSHFYFGEPITDGNTGQPMTDGQILLFGGFMISGFGLISLLAAWSLSNPEHPWIKGYIRLLEYFSPPWRR